MPQHSPWCWENLPRLLTSAEVEKMIAPQRCPILISGTREYATFHSKEKLRVQMELWLPIR